MKQELIWLIQRIPYGMVVSYGELALQLDRQYGISTSWWLVGRMMNNLSPKDYPNGMVCPRRRVINKQWFISALKLWQRGLDQIHLLQWEGIQVVDGKIDMHIYEYNFIW
jgi:alkylated DNA nucleotide flippase Atl1